MTSRLTDQQLDEIDARATALNALGIPGGTWTANPRDEKSVFPPEMAHVVEDVLCTKTAKLRSSVGVFGDQAHAEFAAHAREDVRLLLAEVRRLRAELAREERLHGGTVDDRDQAQEIADKLAYAVAPVEVIGEHSSMNCPWTNAYELITPKADVDKLRARVAEMEPDVGLLEALRAYGVDNWDGYDEAIQAAESASS